MNDPINLLIVDDSKLMRQVLRKIFESGDRVKVIGEAGDGKEALNMISALNPDVITLDINMPVMDGLTTLKHIMIKHPKPTVMCSTLTEEGATVTFDALKYGAVDFIYKPSNQQPESLEEQRENILKKVILASGVEIGAAKYLRGNPKYDGKDKKKSGDNTIKYLCAMGASEGGYAALLKIIPHLDPFLPAAYIIILNEAPNHVENFANYLDKNSAVTVKRAKDGAAIDPGVCFLASGKDYVNLYLFYGEYSLSVNSSPFSNRTGATDTLMLSLADLMKTNGVGVILSGAGDDGAEGLGEIIKNGGSAIIQAPRSCLYKETPLAAIEKCRTNLILPDNNIAEELNKKFMV